MSQGLDGDPICGDGETSSGTLDGTSYVFHPQVPDNAAWMVVDLDTGISFAVNVGNNLAYMHWASSRGEVADIAILDADLNPIPG